VNLGNLYYAASRWTEAIPAYSGHPREAVKEYEASLSQTPSPVQTLHNLGFMRREGLKDPAAVKDHIAQAEREILR
jgi:hypothetical protein